MTQISIQNSYAARQAFYRMQPTENLIPKLKELQNEQVKDIYEISALRSAIVDKLVDRQITAKQLDDMYKECPEILHENRS